MSTENKSTTRKEVHLTASIFNIVTKQIFSTPSHFEQN